MGAEGLAQSTGVLIAMVQSWMLGHVLRASSGVQRNTARQMAPAECSQNDLKSVGPHPVRKRDMAMSGKARRRMSECARLWHDRCHPAEARD